MCEERRQQKRRCASGQTKPPELPTPLLLSRLCPTVHWFRRINIFIPIASHHLQRSQSGPSAPQIANSTKMLHSRASLHAKRPCGGNSFHAATSARQPRLRTNGRHGSSTRSASSTRATDEGELVDVASDSLPGILPFDLESTANLKAAVAPPGARPIVILPGERRSPFGECHCICRPPPVSHLPQLQHPPTPHPTQKKPRLWQQRRRLHRALRLPRRGHRVAAARPRVARRGHRHRPQGLVQRGAQPADARGVARHADDRPRLQLVGLGVGETLRWLVVTKVVRQPLTAAPESKPQPNRQPPTATNESGTSRRSARRSRKRRRPRAATRST
jgi:hypothetical protein